jgi:hypothetical protein
MNGYGRRSTVLRGAAALAIAVGVTGLAQPRALAAQQVSLTLSYTCDFPVIGHQTAPVEIDSNIPDSIAVGQSTAHYAVTASATAPAALAFGLRAFGVSTLTGTVEGQATVEAPQGVLKETLPFTIHKISISAFSSFTGIATGNAPEVTFSKPGKAEIIVGNLTMHLVPLNSNGDVNSLGDMTVPCTLDANQNDVAVHFTITGAASPASSSSPTSAPSSDPVTTTHTASPSPSAHPSTSPKTNTSIAMSPVALAQSANASAKDAGHENGGGNAWMMWLGGLVALVAIGTAAYRYGPKPWKR